MRIAFVTLGLGPGGAERVASLLSNFWAEQGHAVTLVTFDASRAEPFYALNPAISLRSLEASGRAGGSGLGTNVSRMSRLRALLRDLRPDVVVAFTTDASVVSLAAARGLGIPVVISERNQPDRPGLGRMHKLARHLTYPFAGAMVVQTEPIAGWLRARFRSPVHVIPNPVLIGSGNEPTALRPGHRLISVGRLTNQKGFDILIRSFARVAAKHPDWRLIIHGEGPDRAKLERLRDELAMSGRVSLPGLTKEIAAALASAGLFALPSRYEGYPNALLEALAAGLPVVAADCPGGTADILAHGTYGLLVPPNNEAAMSEALDKMMSDPTLRQAYAARARDAVAGLDVSIIGKRWLDVFQQVSAR